MALAAPTTVLSNSKIKESIIQPAKGHLQSVRAAVWSPTNGKIFREQLVFSLNSSSFATRLRIKKTFILFPSKPLIIIFIFIFYHRRVKKIIYIFFLTPFVSFGQDNKLFDILPVTNGKVNYHDTIYINKSRGELANKVTQWYVASNKHAAKLSDKERIATHFADTGIINQDYFIVKWKQPMWTKQYDAGSNNLKVYVWHSIKLTAFENSCYYEISNFRIKRSEKKTFLKPFPSYVDVTLEHISDATTVEKAKIVCNKIDEEVKKIIISLKQFLAN